MSNLLIKQVEFNGASLMAVQSKEDGKIHVGVRWVCQGLGFDKSKLDSEIQKIQKDLVLSKGACKINLPTKGGKQEVLCIELHFLPLWLAKINANIIDNPKIQEKLVDYQLNAADVLAAAFLKQSKQSKTVFRLKPAVKDALDTAEYITAKLGVKLGIAQAAAIKMVEKTTGLELEPLKKLLPAAEYETGYLNATELGKSIGVGAVKVNQLLVEKGLIYQTFSNKGKKEWHLTDAGKEYGEEFPYDASTGHSGYQIKWNESVIPLLTA